MNIKDESVRELNRRAVSELGVVGATVIAIEELSELKQAVTKFMRKKGDIVNLAEEIADVKIMEDWMRVAYSVPEVSLKFYTPRCKCLIRCLQELSKLEVILEELLIDESRIEVLRSELGLRLASVSDACDNIRELLKSYDTDLESHIEEWFHGKMERISYRLENNELQ